MKTKTTIALSTEVLHALDHAARSRNTSRSSLVEIALSAYLPSVEVTHNDDLAIINQRATALNEEALDVLEYQIPL